MRVDSNQVSIQGVRSDFAHHDGFYIDDAQGEITNCVATNCQASGIRLNNNTVNLTHCSFADNGQLGIETLSTWAGVVRNCISWNNAGGNIDSLVQLGECFHSVVDGIHVGLNGNINADPMFVDAGNLDYTLQQASPCVESGNGAFNDSHFVDVNGNSRWLDGDLDLVCLPDMGAHEYADFTLTATGEPKTGGFMNFTLNGPPGGTGLILAGVLDGTWFYSDYGFLTSGLPQTTIVVSPVAIGGTVFIPMPPPQPLLEGFRFSLQGVGLFPSIKGNLTNRYRGRFYN